MSEERSKSAREEAAAWFARLGRRAVTTDSLREFRSWRRTPRNAAAYAEVEALWSRAGALQDDPEIRAATGAALRRRGLRNRLAAALQPSRRFALGLAGAGAAGLVAAAALGPSFLQPSYATGIGEQRLVVLEDGSRVRLNTDSRVSVRFRGGERRILLRRGEAFFEAAHDRTRPFVVDAGAADVRALGTRFAVRRDDGTVQVTLVEGSVRVRNDRGPGAWMLTPNQQLTMAGGHAATRRLADAGQATSWTTGRLTFHETPLGEAVREVNRYATRKLELEPGALANAPVNGVFDTGDTEAFVAAVTTLFGFQAVREPDGSIRLRGPPA